MFPQVYEFDANGPGLLKLEHSHGLTIECVEGTLWITTGDERDIILDTRECFVADNRELILVSAMGGDARARLSERRCAVTSPDYSHARARQAHLAS